MCSTVFYFIFLLGNIIWFDSLDVVACNILIEITSGGKSFCLFLVYSSHGEFSVLVRVNNF